MTKIDKFNEYVNNEKISIINMIEEGENTSSSDLEYIANRPEYRKVVELGKKVIPFLIERDSIVWDRALSELTNEKIKDPTLFRSKKRTEYWRKWAKENGY